MKHTPGPWEGKLIPMRGRMGERGHRNYEIIVGKTRIATIWDHSITGTTEALHNADLIAAAPDLLGACKEWVRWIDNDPQEGEGDLLEMTRQAIAKAEGSQ